MDDKEERDRDKVHTIHPSRETGLARKGITVDDIKSIYICEGVSAKDIAHRFQVPLTSISSIISENKLDKLRVEYLKEGLKELQNMQLTQAKQLMDIEVNLKRLRIIQLEKIVQEYVIYYERHGHLNKIDSRTGEILLNTDGISMQLNIPNAIREINSLKETVSMSEGMKNLLGQIDAIINKSKDDELVDSGIIDVTEVDNLFKRKEIED